MKDPDSDNLTVRRWRPEESEAVVALHIVGLKDAGAYRGSGPWDADLKGHQLRLH